MSFGGSLGLLAPILSLSHHPLVPPHQPFCLHLCWSFFPRPPKQNPRCGQNCIAHAITMELRGPQGHSRTGSSSSAHAPQSGRSRGQHCIFGLTIWAELQKGLVCHPPFSLPARLTASSNKPEWGEEACALRQGHCSFIFLISFLPLFSPCFFPSGTYTSA